MPVKQNIFSILWQSIQGSYRKSIEEGDYKGLVTAVATRGGRLVLASLSLGIAGELLEPISDYFIKRTVGILWESAAKVVYQMRITSSGMAVLEKPRIVTPAKSLILTPPQLQVPSRQILQPPPSLLFNPIRPVSSRPLIGTGGTRFKPYTQRPLTTNWLNTRQPGSGITPWKALVSQAADKQGFGLAGRSQLRNLSGVSGSLQSIRPLTDITYPKWVFQQNTPSFGRQIGNQQRWQKQSVQPFFSHYMQNPQQARQFRTAVTELAQSASSRDDRNMWEKFVDKIDDFLDEWL